MALYASMLERWPVPYTPLEIPTRHGSTFVVASGEASAPPLVLLHGAGTNSAMWLGDIAEYSRRHRVLAVDLLGEPGKSAPHRPSWRGPAYAEWMEDVVDALGIDSAAIVGLSQGGWTALKFAVSQPERVSTLALLSPGGVVPDKLSFVVRALPLMLLGRRGLARINRMVLGGRSVPAEVEEAMITLMTHFRTRLGVLPIFTDAELQRLTMPTLVVMGLRDALRDAEKISARLRKLLPNLTATILPEQGHALLGSHTYVLPFLADCRD